MSKEVRKGIVNHEVNESLTSFMVIEYLALTTVFTYYLTVNFGWNIIASLLLSGAFNLVFFLTKYYKIAGYLIFSCVWGWYGYKLVFFLVGLTGGDEWLAVTFGAFGFLLVYLGTAGAREGATQYFEDIE